ncbi:MAG: 16S rRNA (uracil(1498)-N(3))-methyltransferase [Phycisphaerales bacterium]|nr:16S rRNA (uracil(1498)-N(3))-methyltransferase [Phycisphaerales bacterium]
MHRVHFPHLPSSLVGQTIDVTGDEAQHALRVKRVRDGEAVELLDGQGGIARGRAEIDESVRSRSSKKAEPMLRVKVDQVDRLPPIAPRVEIWCATPKGSRVEDMVEQLSEIGVAAWVPMHTERTIVDPRDGKLDRLRRIAQESAKQCGRAWMLEVGLPSDFEQAIAAPVGTRVLLGHWTGRVLDGPPAVEAGGTIRLLIGPEGDFSTSEMDRAAAAGAERVRFGPHVMRVGTAAVVGAAILMSRSI